MKFDVNILIQAQRFESYKIDYVHPKIQKKIQGYFLEFIRIIFSVFTIVTTIHFNV